MGGKKCSENPIRAPSTPLLIGQTVVRDCKCTVVAVRAGTHYPHVTWDHVILRVQLGCERRFNLEFYGADSRFCHFAYVTWSHVELWSAHAPARLSHFCCRTLRVQLGCEWRFNVEFYDADSLFCHSAYVTWSHVELQSTRHVGHASRNVCDNRNVRGVLAREPTRAPREITWR